MNEPTLRDLVECARRELGFRKRVYPNQVRIGRMKEADMQHETQCMETILKRLIDELMEQDQQEFKLG